MIKHTNYKISLCLCIFLLPLMSTVLGGFTSVYAATYYVAKNGKDSNPGTDQQPWLTISKAASTMVAGDTVYVKAGTYRELVQETTSGSAGHYITYKAYQKDVVVIDGGSGTRNYCFLFSGAYIAVVGFEMTGAKYGGIWLNGALKSSWDKAHHCIVADCYIHNNGNWFSHCDGSCDWHARGGVGIFAQNWSHHNLIYECTFKDNGLFDTKDYGGLTNNNSHDHGVYNTGYDNTVINSVFINNACFGIASHWYPATRPNLTSNFRIAHNTFYKNRRTGLGVNASSGIVMVRNNIFKTNGINHYVPGGGIEVFGTCAGAQAYDTNIFYDNTSTTYWHCDNSGSTCLNYNDCNSICLGSFETGCSNCTVTGYTHADPLLTDPDNDDFTLRSSSPCVNAGVPLTKTSGSGSNSNTVTVADAGWFADPHGSLDSDLIQIGSNKVRMVSVNHTTNVIVVNQNISWSSGDGVSYPYDGSAPDIGAYEYGQTVPPQPEDSTPPAPPSGLTIIQ